MMNADKTYSFALKPSVWRWDKAQAALKIVVHWSPDNVRRL